MARYIGPKSKIARKFGEAIFGADKAFEKRTILPANTETTEGEVKNLNTQFSCLKSKKQNIPMVF